MVHTCALDVPELRGSWSILEGASPAGSLAAGVCKAERIALRAAGPVHGATHEGRGGGLGSSVKELIALIVKFTCTTHKPLSAVHLGSHVYGLEWGAVRTRARTAGRGLSWHVSAVPMGNLDAACQMQTDTIRAEELLTCGNKRARQVGMRGAARAHEKVLNLKGVHSQADAEVAVPHRHVRAALGGAYHDQGALAVNVHKLLGVCEVV